MVYQLDTINISALIKLSIGATGVGLSYIFSASRTKGILYMDGVAGSGGGTEET